MDHDTVEIVFRFEDGSWGVSPPIPRWRAKGICDDLAHGVPWVNDKHVRWAVLRTVNGVLN